MFLTDSLSNLDKIERILSGTSVRALRRIEEELLRHLVELMQVPGVYVEMIHCYSHQGIYLNEIADHLMERCVDETACATMVTDAMVALPRSMEKTRKELRRIYHDEFRAYLHHVGINHSSRAGQVYIRLGLTVPKVRRVQRLLSLIGGRDLEVLACGILSGSAFHSFSLPTSIQRFCPRDHDPPVYFTVGHFCSCFTLTPQHPLEDYLDEVEVVCLLLEYAKVVRGEDYRDLLDASVQCPADCPVERVVDIVKKHALNLQRWSPPGCDAYAMPSEEDVELIVDELS